jgi:betaine-aldehyde dehydrogenase/aminobutyraldehyde dehydrogenase
VSALAAGEQRNVVGGELVGAVDGGSREILNPADGRVIARVPDGTRADVERALAAARAARAGWGATGPGERMEALLALAGAVDQHAGELAALESANAGKPQSLAEEELATCSDELRGCAAAARTMHAPAAGGLGASFAWREPVGVVGRVAPWDYPLLMAVRTLAPALAAGNTIVLKPSEITPLSTLRLAELAAEILPPGVLNVITGAGDPELGGNAPAVVLDDADPAQVAAGLRAASFGNSGQDRTAAARVIATAGIYDALLDELVPAAASVRVGDPAECPEVEMGPVVSAARRQRVLGFLDRATSAGANVLLGGSAGRSPGWFVEPTVVTGARQDAEIVQGEVFGPVVTVQRAGGAEEAIRLANAAGARRAASVWTRDVGRAMRAIRALDFGCVWVNDHRRHVCTHALDDYTRVKHAMISHG